MNTAIIGPDIVRSFINAVESPHPLTAGQFLEERFIFSGWTPKPLGKEAFLGMFAHIKEGIPNLAFNLQQMKQESAQIVTGAIQITGYQNDSFIVPELGLPPIPQQDGHISMPIQPVTFEIDLQSGLIIVMQVTPTYYGGMHGLLRQLDIEIPIIQ